MCSVCNSRIDGDDDRQRTALEIRENIVTGRFECRPATAGLGSVDRSTNGKRQRRLNAISMNLAVLAIAPYKQRPVSGAPLP